MFPYCYENTSTSGSLGEREIVWKDSPYIYTARVPISIYRSLKLPFVFLQCMGTREKMFPVLFFYKITRIENYKTWK